MQMAQKHIFYQNRSNFLQNTKKPQKFCQKSGHTARQATHRQPTYLSTYYLLPWLIVKNEFHGLLILRQWYDQQKQFWNNKLTTHGLQKIDQGKKTVGPT